MSAPTDTQDPELNEASTDSFAIVPSIVGALVIAFGVSGLLDDTGVLPHSYWVVPIAAVIGACALIAAATVRKLMN